MIGALQIFDQAFIVSGGSGGPNYSTLHAVLYLYQTAIADVRFGYAAAIGIALFVLIFTVTLIQRLLFGKAEVGLMAIDVARHSTTVARRPVDPGAHAGRSARVASSHLRAPDRGLAALLHPLPLDVSTSLKSLPESDRVRPAARRPEPARLPRGADRLQLRCATPRTASSSRRRSRSRTSCSLARRLRVRAAALPGPRGPVHARAGDADDPRPAPARAGLPDAHGLGARRHLPGLHR